LEKQVKKGSREAADEKQSVIGRLKEEENDQHDSQMVKRTQPNSRPNGQDDRPMVNQEIDRRGKREGSNQRNTPDGKYNGGESVYD
jgi:hypothetical protein